MTDPVLAAIVRQLEEATGMRWAPEGISPVATKRDPPRTHFNYRDVGRPGTAAPKESA